MTVLAGYVPDATGYAVVGEAVRAARLRRTSLTVVNCVGPDGAAGRGVADERDLDAVSARLRGAEVEHEVRQVRLGGRDVGGCLLALAEDLHAELLVVGLTRRSRVGMLGSTVQQVLLDAACPVRVVQTPLNR